LAGVEWHRTPGLSPSGAHRPDRPAGLQSHIEEGGAGGAGGDAGLAASGVIASIACAGVVSASGFGGMAGGAAGGGVATLDDDPAAFIIENPRNARMRPKITSPHIKK